MAGQIVHLEVPSDDTGQAREFWSSLFGWEFQDFPGPVEYHIARIADEQGLAVTSMEPGKRGTRPYFDVDDVRASRVRVQELGGQADEPQPVPGMGWFATCRDPHGNEFGLWQTDESAA
jgi:predicted enzyme related to lactoylglutathione lyase